MTEILANCARLEPSGTSPQDHLNAFVTWVSDHGVYWEVTDAEVDDGDTDAALLSCLSDDQQIELRMDGSDVSVRLDPEGGRASLGDSPSAAVSPYQIGISASVTYGARANVMEYPDAFIWCARDPTLVFYREGIHAGLVFTPFNANDPDRGVSGHGIMCGSSQIGATNLNRVWLSGQSNPANHQSRVRVGLERWELFRGFETPGIVNSGQVGSSLRFSPIMCGVTDEDNVRLGATRYLRTAHTTDAARTVLPASSGASDQAFIYLGYRTSNDPLLALWRKGVTP